MNCSKKWSSLLFGVFGFLLMVVMLSPVAVAQHIRGALEGSVYDPNGALVPGASVTLRNVSTGAEIKTTTNDSGGFNFQNLETGTYEVTIEKQGFRKYIAKQVEIKVGSVTPIKATLELGATTQTVEIVSTTAEAVVDTSRPTVDGVITAKQIQEIPLNGR